MRLILLRSLWTNGFNLAAAIDDCRGGTYDGIEGPVPLDPRAHQEFSARLRDAAMPFVAEVVTGGGYVPVDSAVGRHLDDFRRQAEAAAKCAPLFLTALAGCDAWPLAQTVDFLGRALAFAESLQVIVSFETHRSRPTFNPWSTRELLNQLPTLRLTCDFSHWCCVCERLVLDTDVDLLPLFASRAFHVHARVGYDQGPQVPHPAAPEYRSPLAAHERWWSAIWAAHAQAGRPTTTMTPEFGPDGYLQSAPFTSAPVASLDEINGWMANRQRDRFQRKYKSTTPPFPPLSPRDPAANPSPAPGA